MVAARNRPRHYQTEFGPGPEIPLPGGDEIPREDLRAVIASQVTYPTLSDLRRADTGAEERGRAERERLYAERMRIAPHDVTGKLVYIDPQLYHPLTYPACSRCGYAMSLFYSSDMEKFTDGNGCHAQGGVFQCSRCPAQQSGVVQVSQTVLQYGTGVFVDAAIRLQLDQQQIAHLTRIVEDHNRRFEENQTWRSDLKCAMTAVLTSTLVWTLMWLMLPRIILFFLSLGGFAWHSI